MATDTIEIAGIRYPVVVHSRPRDIDNAAVCQVQTQQGICDAVQLSDGKWYFASHPKKD